MVGNLLIAPVIEEGATGRKVYLPAGIWYNFWDGSKILGETEIYVDAPLGTIPLFVRECAAVALNLGEEKKVGKTIGNDVKQDKNLCIITFGEKATEEIYDEKGVRFAVKDGEVVQAMSEYQLFKTEEYCQKLL